MIFYIYSQEVNNAWIVKDVNEVIYKPNIMILLLFNVPLLPSGSGNGGLE